jgi:hypothetical protein
VGPSDHFLWPGGRIPYSVDISFDSTGRVNLQTAIDEYTKKTCIRWVPRNSSELAYVRFLRNRNGEGNAGADNCYYPNTVRTATFETCAAYGVMVHGMGHTLCFGHEQDRNDRNKYVNNCGDGKYDHLNFGHLYDYRSIMHTSCNACLAPRMSGVGLNQCGSPDGLSILDAEKLNDMYKCGGELTSGICFIKTIVHYISKRHAWN